MVPSDELLIRRAVEYALSSLNPLDCIVPDQLHMFREQLQPYQILV